MIVVEFDWRGYVYSLMKLGWLSWLGAAIFIWGWIHQHRCHSILVEYMFFTCRFILILVILFTISMILSSQKKKRKTI